MDMKLFGQALTKFFGGFFLLGLLVLSYSSMFSVFVLY